MLPVPLNSSVDHFVHFGASIDQRRRDDGQATALPHYVQHRRSASTMQGVGHPPPVSTLPEAGTTVL